MSEWLTVSLNEIAFINPTEKLAKGTVATKIGMDNLQPFSKKVSAQIQEPYNGGMKFRNGDTIVARITPCLENGKTAYIDTLDDGAVGYGSTEYIVLRAKEDSSDSHFLYYFARSDTFRDVAIASMTGSSGRQRVQTDVVVNHTFELPSLPEQKAIASVLSSLDDKIDLLHRQNKTLEAMAETLFRQWFIEEAKEEWGEIPFGYLIELHDSKRIPLSQLQRDERRLGALYPYYGASGIIDQINEYIFDGDYLLLSEDGENLRTRKTPIAFEAKGKFWVNNHAHVMQAKPPFTNGFLRILLEGENLDSIITGAVQPKINQANLVSYKIPNFPHELVIKYVGLSNPWFCKVHSNAKQIQTLENLRDTLLPKLMSGEVRVQYQTEEVA